jgi:hypothetical protein
VTEDIPLDESNGVAKGWQISRVVFDAGASGAGRSLRRATPPLIVQDELSPLGQRSQCGPQEIVIEQQSAIHARERRRTGYLRREVYGELEPTCANGAP